MRVLLVDLPELLVTGVRTQLGQHATVDLFDGDLLEPDRGQARGYDLVIHGLGRGSDDEDRVLRSTLGTWNLLRSLDPRGRYVQLSSMRQFDGYDDGWAVAERWLPRPGTDAEALAHHLGELASRELSRSRTVTTIVLRLDEVVPADQFAAGPVHPRWLHVDDAVAAVRAVALAELPTPELGGAWIPVHAVRGDGRFRLGLLGQDPYDVRPVHRHPTTGVLAVPRIATIQPIDNLPRPERITVYGAGGPLGAISLELLRDRALVRATDVRPLAELAQRPPQSVGAPLPSPVPPPHEELVVDITDAEQVRRAAVDADCLVNVSVVREDVALAFRVNVLGAWHTMRAAVSEGVAKVVHTGPTLSIAPYPLGSIGDRRVDGTQTLRSGDWIYLLTKLLGQEVCRLFAEEHTLACPVLLYCGFTLAPPEVRHRNGQTGDFVISWPDSGRSVVAAIDVTRLPEPSPVINILAPQPHDHWSTDRARDILGWQATDALDRLWYDPRVPGSLTTDAPVRPLSR